MNHFQARKTHPIQVLILLFGLITALGFTRDANAQDSTATKKVVEVKDVKEYVGSYDGRKFTAVQNNLSYFRDGMPVPAQLKYIAEDEFEVVIPAGAQVRGAINGQFPTMKFNRNEDGTVVSLSIIAPDKSIMGTYPKSEDKPKG